MTSISRKKREAGKSNKRRLILDDKIKILDVVKKRKMSYREIAEQFKIGKTQRSQCRQKMKQLSEQNTRTFKETASNILKEKTIKNTNLSTQFSANGLKTAKLLGSM